MKPKTMILMGVAITCGLGASYMTSRLLAERGSGDQEKVAVLVAKKNLSMGDSIKVPDDLFEAKDFIRGTEPRNGIDNPDTLKGRVLKRSLRAGDFVTSDDLYGDKEGHGLWAMLPPGYRAMGIRVNMEEIAGGFASLPLSRVDIINTVRRGDDKSTYAQVILEDVLVVAADTQTQRDDQGRAMPANVVTVAVKPEDAMKVRLAGAMGQLSLVLRKLNDGSRVAESIITAESVRMNRKHGEDDSVETPVSPTNNPPPVAVAPRKKVEVATAPDANGKRHVLSVREGEHTKQTEFLLDEHNEVLNPDVQRSELSPPRPASQRSPQSAPPKKADDDDDL